MALVDSNVVDELVRKWEEIIGLNYEVKVNYSNITQIDGATVSYYSCLHTLYSTRKMVPIKKRASSFPIIVCHPA